MTKSPEELAESNLAYYGEARLNRLPDADLKRLAQLMDVEPVDPRRNLINSLLEAKEARKPKRSPLSKERAAAKIQDAVRNSPTLKAVNATVNNVPPQILDEKDNNAKPVFKERHALKICAFNSKKIAMKAGVSDDWIKVVQVLSTFDVVLVSEVPLEKGKKEEETKTYIILLLLNHYSPEGTTWSAAVSEPSGPGNPETHVAFVKEPIRVLQTATHHEAGDTKLDHAPFSILLEDDRFESQDSKVWAVTSVHFPPTARARARDAQLRAFLNEYYTSSDFRLSTPLTAKGAKDAKEPLVNHVVCGDFNVFPGEEDYALSARHFAPPLLGELISTSSGEQSYDNFIVGLDTQLRFSIGAEVMELSMPQKKGQKGVSDHNPIFAKFTEAKLTKKGQKKASKASAE
jgi:endonuclease/exonuclease/phosphatase family metal-dependent hydrolase